MRTGRRLAGESHVARTFALSLAGVGLCLAAGLASPATPDDEAEGIALFQNKIRPVLVEHCYECHSDRKDKPDAEFRVDTRAGLRGGGTSGQMIEPGKPDSSLLIAILEFSSEIAQMPPKGKLPSEV